MANNIKPGDLIIPSMWDCGDGKTPFLVLEVEAKRPSGKFYSNRTLKIRGQNGRIWWARGDRAKVVSHVQDRA